MDAKKLCTLTVMSMIPFLSKGASSLLTFSKGATNPLNRTVFPLDVCRIPLLPQSPRPEGVVSPDCLLTRGEDGVERAEGAGDSTEREALRI